MRDEYKDMLTAIVWGIAITVIVILIASALFCIRLDFESGSHRIIPTSVDQDIWGNYKVYFRTTEYTKNSEEDFYYIDKSDKELAEEMLNYIKNKKEVIVYYDKYIGWKGLTAPESSPITRIEIIEEEGK